MSARQEMLSALKSVRDMHKDACDRTVADVKSGKIDLATAQVDIEAVTQQARVWRSPDALHSHHLISDETCEVVKSLEG